MLALSSAFPIDAATAEFSSKRRKQSKVYESLAHLPFSAAAFSQGTADDNFSISSGTSGAGAAGGAALPCGAEPSASETPSLIPSSAETGSVNALNPTVFWPPPQLSPSGGGDTLVARQYLSTAAAPLTGLLSCSAHLPE